MSADEHVGYETQMLVYGALELSRYPVIPPPGGFKRPIVDDALLEATLVHVRLLHDFLDGTTRGRKHDVKATDWCADWSCPGFLDAAVRRRINRQVAHLSSLRAGGTWELATLARTCCETLEAFFDAVAVHAPQRLPAFARARNHVRRGLAELRGPAISSGPMG